MPVPVDPRLRVNPLSVACSFCGAKPWHRCTSIRAPFPKEAGRPVPHAARQRLAREQVEGKGRGA